MILAPTTPQQQSGDGKRRRSHDEIAIRAVVEAWGRKRWPEARVCHELVIDRGTVRADLAFVAPSHIASIEIKSAYDTTARLLQQASLFRLATPETWVVTASKHLRDVKLIRYLMPTVGVALVKRMSPPRSNVMQIEVLHEAEWFTPYPEALLALLWRDELHVEACRAGLWKKKTGTHGALVQAMLALPPYRRLEAVCRQLRARRMAWRADPAVTLASLS